MRVIFMGTSGFAIPSLHSLILSKDHQINVVITQPDSPQGRGLKVCPPPVKSATLQANIPVIQTDKLSSENIYDLLSEMKADVIFCAAYGKYLPERILTVMPFGAVNLHPSKLPLYRGAAPIQRALMDGCTKTAVTFIRMSREMDAGDMLLQEDLDVLPEETAGELLAKAAELGGRLLPKLLTDLENGAVVQKPQDHNRATFAPAIEKEEGLIDWNDSSLQIFNRWRGLTPKPGVYSFLESKRFILSALRLTNQVAESDKDPGTIFAGGGKLLVAAGDGKLIEIKEIKPEGKGTLTATAYINGYRPAGKRFSNGSY
jgi:methionyl-tRNA formyltransferase